MKFSIGLDLGQRRDPAAMVIVERTDRYPPGSIPGYGGTVFNEALVRFAATFPLGTPYPVVVEAVRDAVQHQELRGQCAVVVDATGVGVPVIDMFRAARLGCNVAAVTITSGNHQTSWNSEYSVPKTDLIAGIQVLLEQGRMRIAKNMPQRGQLMRELLNMRMTQSSTGKVRLGAGGHDEHDDLVIALALACWRAKRR